MKFIINEQTQSLETGVSYIDSGIHENVELAEIVYKKNEDTGTQFIAFYWEDPSGARVSKTEWEPRAPRVNPDGFIKTEADAQKALESKMQNQSKRIKHMLCDSGILKPEELNVDADSFEDYAKQIIELVGDKNKGVKARIKVVYDDNNYTTLPSYVTNLGGSYCWIEPMTVPKEESKIKILGMDKMERVTADNVTGSESPFNEETKEGNSTAGATANDGDLPF